MVSKNGERKVVRKEQKKGRKEERKKGKRYERGTKAEETERHNYRNPCRSRNASEGFNFS
jgi:hypothetical protein